MLDLFKKSSQSQIGLDISPEGITMVVIEEDKGLYTLKNYVRHYFQEKVFQNGHIGNFDILAEELKILLNQYKPDTREAVISVPSSSIFMKTITLPDIPEDELELIIPQEASKHLPLSEKEMNVDFQILKNSRKVDATGKKIDVVLCAASKALIRSYLEVISRLGLHVVAVDVSAFAMINALANAELINDPGKTYVSVLIDYANTDINVIQNGMPVFSHTIEAGRKNIIENICNSLSKNRNEVLELLPEVEVLIPGAEMSENPELSKAANAVKGVYSGIGGEIQKAIEFFNSDKAEPVEIDKIIMGGPGICVQNIDKYIYNKLRVRTVIFNPFTNLPQETQSPENAGSDLDLTYFSTGVGLALKELEN